MSHSPSLGYWQIEIWRALFLLWSQQLLFLKTYNSNFLKYTRTNAKFSTETNSRRTGNYIQKASFGFDNIRTSLWTSGRPAFGPAHIFRKICLWCILNTRSCLCIYYLQLALLICLLVLLHLLLPVFVFLCLFLLGFALLYNPRTIAGFKLGRRNSQDHLYRIYICLFILYNNASVAIGRPNRWRIFYFVDKRICKSLINLISTHLYFCVVFCHYEHENFQAEWVNEKKLGCVQICLIVGAL